MKRSLNSFYLFFFTENEEEVAPLYLNSNHLNSRVARSAEPYYYSYWNDLKRGDPSHLLRFNKRGGMQDDHLLRFAKKYDDHLLRFAKNPMINSQNFYYKNFKASN